ncbi:hypothetical protein NUW54_g14320 [Trametes sanguinea]|uniref:Uncharacterized protein n=1 Tax=Trametes sanguinea TaxID=158606 RepID=A0ACC1MEV7_9APHY|nr:hypothetical protein NUW54_g14320 [Trametes sanguinea]
MGSSRGSDSHGKGKTREVRIAPQDVIIDKETERISAPRGPGEVQLRYTSARTSPVESPRSRQSPHVHVAQSISRTNSSSPQTATAGRRSRESLWRSCRSAARSDLGRCGRNPIIAGGTTQHCPPASLMEVGSSVLVT